MVQPVKSNLKTSPKPKQGDIVWKFTLNNTEHLITESLDRFYENRFGTLTHIRQNKTGTFNRVNFKPTRRNPIRKSNPKLRGTGTQIYKETRTYNYTTCKEKEGYITYQTEDKRDYSSNMKKVTDFKKATEYAQKCLGDKCPKVAFNWCHLIGRGGGGSDKADNIMAATTHANSEQLLLERVLYQLKNHDIKVRVTGVPYTRHKHLAERFLYHVYNSDGDLVMTHYINGLRTDSPDQHEYDQFKEKLLSALFEKTTLE